MKVNFDKEIFHTRVSFFDNPSHVWRTLIPVWRSADERGSECIKEYLRKK